MPRSAGFGAFFYFPSTIAFTASIRSTIRLLGNRCNGFAVDGGKACAAIIPVELDGRLRKSVIVQIESNA